MSDISTAKIFPVCGLPFCFNTIYWNAGVIIIFLIKFNLSIFSSYDSCTFSVLSRESLPFSESQIFFPVHPLRGFKILTSVCKSRSIFNYLFYMNGTNFKIHFFFSPTRVPEPSVEKILFSSLNYHGTFGKKWLSINPWVYFWTASTVSFICMSSLMPKPRCFDELSSKSWN